ncbi:MAG: ribokinase [Armatimonadota bacterium]
MRPGVLVVGSSNTDMIINVPALPLPGQTVPGKDFKTLPGGKGANQAVAAARLGADVTFIAALGDDSFGTESLNRLRDEGIRTDYIVTKPGAHSGVALIFVDDSGENVIAVSLGANQLLSPDDILPAKDVFTNVGIVILQLEIPMETVISTAKLAKEAGCTVLLNPAPMPADGLPDELLQLTDILVPNKGELLSMVPGAETIEYAAADVLNCGPKTLVVTLGGSGAMMLAQDECFYVPAIEVSAIDTVGAGDCFTAALGVAIASGESHGKALQFAVAASGLSTLVCGAQEGMPGRDAVDKYLLSIE